MIYGSDEDLTDTIILHDSGIVLNGTTIAIVNISTLSVCTPNECGEIWISNAWPGDRTLECFKLDGMDQPFYRTRDRGFLWPIPLSENDECDESGWTFYDKGKPFQFVLFVLGSYEKEMFLNGFCFPIQDIETDIETCFPYIQSSIVFMFNHQSICCIEIADETQIVNSTTRIIFKILKKYRLMFDMIVFSKPGQLAKSRLKEKQRVKITTAFRLGKLPIFYKIRPI